MIFFLQVDEIEDAYSKFMCESKDLKENRTPELAHLNDIIKPRLDGFSFLNKGIFSASQQRSSFAAPPSTSKGPGGIEMTEDPISKTSHPSTGQSIKIETPTTPITSALQSIQSSANQIQNHPNQIFVQVANSPQEQILVLAPANVVLMQQEITTLPYSSDELILENSGRFQRKAYAAKVVNMDDINLKKKRKLDHKVVQSHQGSSF